MNLYFLVYHHIHHPIIQSLKESSKKLYIVAHQSTITRSHDDKGIDRGNEEKNYLPAQFQKTQQTGLQV